MAFCGLEASVREGTPRTYHESCGRWRGGEALQKTHGGSGVDVTSS